MSSVKIALIALLLFSIKAGAQSCNNPAYFPACVGANCVSTGSAAPVGTSCTPIANLIPVPSIQWFGSTGPITTIKCWMGSTTSTTSGTFGFDYHTAGFIAPPNIQLTSSTAVPAGANFANVLTSNNTGMTGEVSTGTAILLLSSFTIVQDVTPVTVYITACGN